MDVTTVHRTLPEARGLARNTVQSTLERLVRKGLAERRKIGRAYEYRATLSRADWITQTLGALLDSIPGSHGGPALASFVDLAERAGDASLEELEKLVRRRRRALSEDS
jgi:predicted transcriptional regulator